MSDLPYENAAGGGRAPPKPASERLRDPRANQPSAEDQRSSDPGLGWDWHDLIDFETFLEEFRNSVNFAYTKINHGFWERLATVYAQVGRPVPPGRAIEADRVAGRAGFFAGGFVDEFLPLLMDALVDDDPSLFVGLELSAWPQDNAIVGTPLEPEQCEPIFQEFSIASKRRVDGLLLKKSVMDGGITRFFDLIREMRIILVGPEHVGALVEVARLKNVDFVPIHSTEARAQRFEIEQEIRSLLAQYRDEETCVLLQAGALAPYWILRMRPDFPRTRWVDGGLAFSIGDPEDLLRRDWGKVYRREILATFTKLCGQERFPVRDLIPQVAEELTRASSDPRSTHPVDFIEEKGVDFTRIVELLAPTEQANRWANRGPAWRMLGNSYHEYLGCSQNVSVVPCANGGIALAALAQLHGLKAGDPLRWVVSAFGFANTRRGPFADALVVDCDSQGLLSLPELDRLDPSEFDGLVVTNPFGLVGDFRAYTEYAKRSGKVLLIDNAAGLGNPVPDCPYQSFSLHHTKPFGHGEGGLAMLPEDERETLLSLMEYSPVDRAHERFWAGNGKLSELASAALLARLETAPEWVPFYRMQSVRIHAIAQRAGLRPLLLDSRGTVAMSTPFLAPQPAPLASLRNDHFVIGKYYRPLVPLPQVAEAYSRLVNIPSHPDMRRIDSDVLLNVMRRFAGQ